MEHSPTPTLRRTLLLIVSACSLLLGACASLPPRDSGLAPPSHALVPDPAAPLVRMATAAVPRRGDSAFKLLPLGASALDTRLELARQARHSIDLQTFVFNGDPVGITLLRTLRDAALRGVRVRLLIDDLHTDSAEALLSDLAGYDNIEVRLVTPFTRLRGSRTAKLLSSLDQLSRINHRMHNKLFVADNTLTVFGGRNVADEYFMRRAGGAEGGNFIDLDALAAGAIVAQMSASFDRYWNSEHAWPLDLIVPPNSPRGSGGGRAERRARFDAAAAAVAPIEPDLGVPARLRAFATAPEELRAGQLVMTSAAAELFDDPVDKLASSRVADRSGTVRAQIGAVMRAAALEVFVISPYFIPGELGMAAIRGNRERGVRLRLLTNSLAATDEPAVHAGYVAYRREMVEAGVEVYELSPSLARSEARLGRFGSTPGALHAKVVVIDQAALFIGSMNLDGRSERYNTELGVMIRSPALAREMLALIDFESSTWRVRLGPSGQLQWVNRREAGETVHEHEPEAGLLRKLGSRLLGALLPHDWL